MHRILRDNTVVVCDNSPPATKAKVSKAKEKKGYAENPRSKIISIKRLFNVSSLFDRLLAIP